MNLNKQKKRQALTSHGVSSLVIDNSGGQTGERNVTITGFYFDFAAKKEHSSASTLRSLLKQIVLGLEEVLEWISRAY